MGAQKTLQELYRPECLEVPTPSYVVAEDLLEHNLAILHEIEESTGAHVLLAQKCFSMYHYYPLIAKYLSGTTASGLYEAKLGHEEMGKENHVFSPAYKEEDFPELVKICDHILFNSFAQWEKFGPEAVAQGVSCGLRINPERSTQKHAIYDPCAEGSRLGVRLRDFEEDKLAGLEGLHFHTLCEQGADALAVTLEAVEEKFGKYLPQMKWLNFGGGHHITREGYDIALLKKCIRHMQENYNLTIYIEPGEAVALNAGFLVATVLDIQKSRESDGIAILDTSAACHMPDVIEMPYRPPVIGSGGPHEKAHTYTFAGPTCLAGDTIGTYSFDEKLAVGGRIVFGDMAIYTMVKNNTFNGMPLPDIIASKKDGSWQVVRHFGYEDFKMRL
ncbi:carboxynorspermidine decarboxylase [uncultured Mitsuokella sp.]|mgnify:CR=1 FL=1|uniref:carboxynorspermidine decarboxylase n=1 Tax=uncultured Mitsuokella sp. TaxID=453120 RepID=UPI0025EA7D16|nr:carboxynorspermidine decarboxylase [uncultured Mitsuokella sp.]